MSAYYNENDPKAAAWLRELIRQGHIAPGDVDERSIEDVIPYELKRYTQCHFFAGIGVWSYALRLAGWPDDRPVWTGSCPCQPFSAAGKGTGTSDERHLWPSWQHLIRECKPSRIFGEQVASKAADIWADLVQDDLEALGYAFGAVPFPAASVGAFHIRERLYWVANAELPESPRLQPVRGALVREQEAARPAGSGDNAAIWRDLEWAKCADQKFRPIEPGTFPLAHGAPEVLGRLRGYGNAIVSEAAKVFIEASGLA